MKPVLGTCYYPEHWPEEIWVEDARRMAELGLVWVRIGEFAWSRIEPSEDKFEWDWLDRAVEVLANAGLKIIMGTPTATPPKWILNKHPDMVALDKNGNPRGFGSRRHYCFSHQGYRQECVRIVEKMAERYGHHPAVQSWQTDNEYGCHDTTISYSQSAREEFHNWLSQKYQSPDALNKAWGNVFWSMEYSEFSDVDLPNLTVTEPNPSHVMDFKRFASAQLVSFNKLQADVIRKYTDAPLVHNYMGKTTDFDHFDVGADLDIASWDSYPIGFLEMISSENDAFKAEYLQQGDPDFQAFHHDLYRSVGNGRLWVMEQQPGPVNWASYNPSPLDGMVRLWSLEAIAHGAESVNYFRWRQAPFAQEQMHAGLLRPDSEEARGMLEARQVKADLEAIGEVTQNQAPVALIFDYPSQWATDTQPQGANFYYFNVVYQTYQILRSLGVDVDVISKDQDLDGYKVAIVPSLFTLEGEFKTRLNKFDGLVVAGPRFNSKTADFQIPANLAPDIDHLDMKVSRLETLREGIHRELENGGYAHSWIEELETSETIIEKTIDGNPVLIQKDNWHYLGSWLDETAYRRILSSLLRNADIAFEEMPRGLRKRETKEHTFVWNYSTQSREYRGQTIASTDVIWIKK
ncbi:MAG: beta-galactosidase [Lentilitoribacter sp.]